uniref:Xylulose kinase-1 n=1 Tax=Tanacetum cinerariifolium TaxID=118510 RepID=A0A6L2M6X5_TANCI|nr:hypothetical protein [Tanacetum cinerariifolium]
MSTLKFVDVYNLVVFLSKPTECEGFEQIVNFLNVNPIKYALTVNPTVCTSCIEQFWAIVKAKTVNGEGQLQALADGKKIIIIGSTIRRYLQLEDVEGVDCLPKAVIFKLLALIGDLEYKDAEGVDCLPNVTIFEQLTLMGFVHVILDKQLEGMSNHNRIYVSPSHTKKIFENTRRKQRPRKTKRKDIELPQTSGPTTNVADKAVNVEMNDSLVRVATTTSNIKAEEDVETLWKLVKAKYGSSRPERDYERVVWGDLKVMFKPHIEDEVWKMQQRYNVVRWTLFNSCRVHCLSFQSGHIYMLVEKRYPLTQVTITDMLNKKLHTDYFDEMTYQLLKLITKQLKNK